MQQPLPPISKVLKPQTLESFGILRKLGSASRALAELKGVASIIPRPAILINTLAMQEAKDSSEIENIITTHDELFRNDLFPEQSYDAATKEVIRYREALKVGFDLVTETGLLTSNHLIRIQGALENSAAGFRQLPGTILKDGAGRVVYTPPQHPDEVRGLMADLDAVINDPAVLPVDPLIKMAVIHHQFESIHPFYDGNGRTGRILNVLYLVKEGLLDSPILYLSRYIVRNKPEYYRLLQTTRESGNWEPWVTFMLEAVESTAKDTVGTVHAIHKALVHYKQEIRARHKFYSQDLINNLFLHPYTRVSSLEKDLGVTRLTATRYLDALAADGLLTKRKAGRSSLYVNTMLYAILSNPE